MSLTDRNNWPTAVVVMILLILIAGIVPSIFLHTNGTESDSFQVVEGETVILKDPLRGTLNTVNQNPGEIDVTLVDFDTGNTTQVTGIGIGNTTTTTIENQDVSITYVEAISDNESVVRFEYPVFYSWDNTAVAFVGSIGAIILAIFLYLLLVVMGAIE